MDDVTVQLPDEYRGVIDRTYAAARRFCRTYETAEDPWPEVFSDRTAGLLMIAVSDMGREFPTGSEGDESDTVAHRVEVKIRDAIENDVPPREIATDLLEMLREETGLVQWDGLQERGRP